MPVITLSIIITVWSSGYGRLGLIGKGLNLSSVSLCGREEPERQGESHSAMMLGFAGGGECQVERELTSHLRWIHKVQTLCTAIFGHHSKQITLCIPASAWGYGCMMQVHDL